MGPHSKFHYHDPGVLVLICAILASICVHGFRITVSAQDVTSQQALYERFKANVGNEPGKDPAIAYESAREYLRRYPQDKSENAQYMRRFVAAYEKVTGGSPSISENSSTSRIPAEKHYERGQTHARLQEWSEAEQEFRQAVILEPNNLVYRETLAQSLTKQEKWAEAESEYAQLVKTSPETASYRRGLAISLLKQRRWKESDLQFRKLFLLGSSGDDVVDFAYVLAKEGNWEEFDEVIRSYRGAINSERLGDMYAEVGRTDQARQEYIFCLLRLPGLADPGRIDLSQYLKLVGPIVSKIRANEKEEVPPLSNTFWHSGNHLIFFRPTNTFESFDSSLTNHAPAVGSQFWWLQIGSVVILTWAAHYEVGVIKGNEITTKNSRDFPFSYEATDSWEQEDRSGFSSVFHGYSLLLVGELEVAEQRFRKALELPLLPLGNVDYSARRGLGIALANQGKWDEAIKYLEGAAKICKKNPYPLWCAPGLDEEILKRARSHQTILRDLIFLK